MIIVRRIGLAGLLMVLAATITTAPQARSDSLRPFVGTLMTNPAQADADARAGLSMAMLQVAWSQAQPVQGGGLSASYLAQVERVYRTFRAAGLQVTLDPGLQYPPNWVFHLGGASTRFVDQYGDTWAGGSGENVPDAVFDPAVQTAEANYLGLLAKALGADSFAAVRAGGLLDGELHLPPMDYAGHDDDWWAYGPGSLPERPAFSYRPGISPANRVAAASFLAAYLRAVGTYQDFIVESTARDFSASVEVLYPSFGVRPGDEQAATASGLDGVSPRADELVMGAVPAVLVPRIPAERRSVGTRDVIVAYTTWLDGPGPGTTPQAESPIAYLASIAQPLDIPLAGENTAGDADNRAALQLCATRARDYHLLGFMWFDDAALALPGGLTAHDVAQAAFG